MAVTTAPHSGTKTITPGGGSQVPGSTLTGTSGPTLNVSQQGAYDLMYATLSSWGLSSLAADLKNLIVGGDTSPDTLALALSQTDAYKQRFIGNEARKKAGLRELSPAEYLALEEQYHSLASQYGIPSGYLNKQMTDAMIGGDVSAAEANDRIKAASDLVYNAPPEAQKAWDQFYGGGQGGAIAAILDPKRAAPLVERQAMAAQIGGAALAQGLTANQGNAERFAQAGVSLQQARQAYSEIAQRLPWDQAIASRFGTTFGQNEEENATLGGDAATLQKQQSVYAQEASLFGGHGGGTTNTGNEGSNF